MRLALVLAERALLAAVITALLVLWALRWAS